MPQYKFCNLWHAVNKIKTFNNYLSDANVITFSFLGIKTYNNFLFIIKYCAVVDKRNIQFIKDVGLKIRSLRISKGYTQQHLANLCDIELSQINRIELGKINTSIAHLKLIADALNIHIKELFDL